MVASETTAPAVAPKRRAKAEAAGHHAGAAVAPTAGDPKCKIEIEGRDALTGSNAMAIFLEAQEQTSGDFPRGE